MATEQATQSIVSRERVKVGAAHRPRAGARPWTMGALLAVLVAGVLGYRALHARRGATFEVRSVVIARGPIAAKVSATGALSALVTVNVGSQVSGRIASLNADFGSQVRAGDVVASIEPSLFRAAVQQARANHASASANIERAQAQLVNFTRAYERARTLAEKKFLAAADFDAADANLRVARAEVKAAQATQLQASAALEQAQLNLRYTTIVSPIDGVVISRNVDVGQTVAATLQAPTLFTIARDLTHMQVDTNVPEADVGKIREGMPVSFSVDAYPGRVFTGRVRQVRDNAQTLQNVVTYDAVVDVDNSQRALKPGMTASVTFVYAERTDALCVPNAALRFRPEPSVLAAWNQKQVTAAAGEHDVWVLRGDHAEAVPVHLGISDGSVSELLAPSIAPGARVVVETVAPGEHG